MRHLDNSRLMACCQRLYKYQARVSRLAISNSSSSFFLSHSFIYAFTPSTFTIHVSPRQPIRLEDLAVNVLFTISDHDQSICPGRKFTLQPHCLGCSVSLGLRCSTICWPTSGRPTGKASNIHLHLHRVQPRYDELHHFGRVAAACLHCLQ